MTPLQPDSTVSVMIVLLLILIALVILFAGCAIILSPSKSAKRARESMSEQRSTLKYIGVWGVDLMTDSEVSYWFAYYSNRG